MALIIVFSKTPLRPYFDKQSGLTEEEYFAAIEHSSTV
jgi:hypothetical protein